MKYKASHVGKGKLRDCPLGSSTAVEPSFQLDAGYTNIVRVSGSSASNILTTFAL